MRNHIPDFFYFGEKGGNNYFMANTEGVIFQGMVMNEKEFKEAFKEMYAKRGLDFQSKIQKEIIEPLNQFSHYFMSKSFYEGYAFKKLQKDPRLNVYRKWEEIEKDFFGNESVALLAGISYDNGKSYNYDFTLPNEIDVINKNNGLRITSSQVKQVSDLTKKLNAELQLQNLFNEHYGKLVATLDQKLTKEQAAELHRLIPNRIYKKVPSWPGHSPNEIFYSNKSNYGNRIDGYLNHTASEDSELFTFMKAPAANEDAILNYNFRHIFQLNHELMILIKNSLNTTAWYTGGDIIITDGNGHVVFNIQLKTTMRSQAEWKIGVSKLYTFLRQISALQNWKDIANILYENLKIEVSGQLKDEIDLEKEAIKTVQNIITSAK